MKWKEQAKQRFSTSADANKWSDIYSSNTPNVEAISFRKRRDFSVQYVLENTSKNSTVLDLGCGAGPVLVQLQKSYFQLIGIDYSSDMLQHARRELDNDLTDAILIRAECEKVPIADETIDFVVCLGVISYAESIDVAIQELYRITKPGGKVIVSYRNKYNDIILDPILFIKYLITRPFRMIKSEEKKIGRSIPRTEVLASIRKCSFNIEHEEQIGFGNLRFNGTIISDGNLAIKINMVIDKLLRKFKLKFIYRLISDVHIFVLSKPD